MDDFKKVNHMIAVIGAGPAGLFAARQLAEQGNFVVIINRDIKPGGLAEYGIYPTKYKMKDGLRKQFRQILEHPNIEYYGNVTVGDGGTLNLFDIQMLAFQAILITAGAQGTKWLGLPGENTTQGVYHAKDLVYHYNKLPPFSQKQFEIGRKVAIIGVGNVMSDIARFLITELKVDEVIPVARRGPAEVKFDKKEIEHIIAHLDIEALDAEIERVKPHMLAVDQDPQAAHDYILSALPKADPPQSNSKLKFIFLASPTRVIGDEFGNFLGLEVEDNYLIRDEEGETKARSLGTRRLLDVDTVVFCIGDQVDKKLGLPTQGNQFVKNPFPEYPIDGISYESYNPLAGKAVDGIFVAGWSREASVGLVGVARKDGERCARAISQYLENINPVAHPDKILQIFEQKIKDFGKPIITKTDLLKLQSVEQAEMMRLGLEDFKYVSNEEMLRAIEYSHVFG
ncbi:MAG: FAD-dependent oxidoreductase [Anaerolineales bacterium]|nr:FAD-dependent oxidoreductase [Anaerolineales bacterium]